MRIKPETRIEDIEIGGHRRPHIEMCVLCENGMMPSKFWLASSRLAMPINGQVSLQMIEGFEVGIARNMAVEEVLKRPEKDQPRYLFFFGDDMIPAYDGMIKLHEEIEQGEWDCLTGLYYMKGDPPTPLTWRDDRVGRLRPGRDFQKGEVIWVDLTGLDFTLLRTSMLRKMEKEFGPPYFKTGPSTRRDENNSLVGIVTHTEDTWFYGRVKKLGGTIGVHTGVRVGHYNKNTGALY